MQPRQITVLCIEDNPDDQVLIETHLGDSTRFQFELSFAKTLQLGVEQATETKPDVILLDLGLPGSSGIDTFLDAQRRLDAFPIICLTGNDSDDLGEEAIEEGAQDYLVKGTVDCQMLERAISYAIRRKRTEIELHEKTDILRSILNSIADGVVVVGEDGVCIERNPAAVQMLGFDPKEDKVPQEEWPEHHASVFMPDRETPHPPESLPLSRAREGKKVKEHEVFMKHSMHLDGILVSVNASPLRDDRGRTHGGVAVFRDITEAKRNQQKIERLNNELRQRIKERVEEFEAFGYHFSKTINEPLREISSLADQVEKSYSARIGEEGVEMTDAISGNCKKITRTLHTMSELSRTPRTEMRAKLGLDEAD